MKALLVPLFLALALAPAAHPSPSPADEDAGDGSVPLKTRIGQMLLMGFRGTRAVKGGELEELICGLKVGGVVIFEKDLPSKSGTRSGTRNIVSRPQLAKLTKGLQSMARECGVPPLLIAIDMEGGAVTRLKQRYGFPAVPSHETLAKMGNPKATRAQARQIGRMLEQVGINWDLAPVVDVNLNPENPIIGKWGRSFSDDPEVVSLHALEFVAGLRDRGILSSLKHFPGHGSSRGDSHRGLVDVTETAVLDIELAPYRSLLDEDMVDSVMTSHVINRDLDPELPASLSKAVITGILRKQMGFDGVVVTEDLQMKGVADRFDLAKASVLAVLAGSDMVSVSNNCETYEPGAARIVVEALLKAVEEGELDAERIDRSYERIMRLKARLKAGR